MGSQTVPYGYMWWSEPDAFRAYRIFGQSIYINPSQQVVIVVWSAQPKLTGSALISDNVFFNAVIGALH
ncbi:MAG: hypothetical protein JO138_18310 [Acidobacteriaceae bacterium]|nr:hypothetical protein [Acidobacteriaceae bacterium]